MTPTWTQHFLPKLEQWLLSNVSNFCICVFNCAFVWSVRVTTKKWMSHMSVHQSEFSNIWVRIWFWDKGRLLMLSSPYQSSLIKSHAQSWWCRTAMFFRDVVVLRVAFLVIFNMETHQSTFFQFWSNSNTWIWISLDTDTLTHDKRLIYLQIRDMLSQLLLNALSCKLSHVTLWRVHVTLWRVHGQALVLPLGLTQRILGHKKNSCISL